MILQLIYREGHAETAEFLHVPWEVYTDFIAVREEIAAEPAAGLCGRICGLADEL